MASFPTITYSNIKHKVDNGYANNAITYRDENILLAFNNGLGNNATYRASFKAPFNTITGNYTSNMELNRFEIRVNPVETSDYGPGIGNVAFFDLDILANTQKSFTININNSVFTGSQSDTYRICLMAQSSVDHSWDCTQLFLVVGPGTVYKPVQSDGYDVHGATEIPRN